MGMPIKILIVDDHALLRQGLRMVLELEEDFEIIGEAADGKKAIEAILAIQPDIVLLDLNMPIMGGMEVVKQLQLHKLKTKVIVLTIHDDDNYALDVLKNGVMGYLLKDVEKEVLIGAIRAVYRGQTFVQPEINEKLFGEVACINVNAKAEQIWLERRGDRLTLREMDVLHCIAKGYNNQKIAETLFVSEKTVKNHLTNIFRKINVNDRTQALLYALKNNLMKLN